MSMFSTTNNTVTNKSVRDLEKELWDSLRDGAVRYSNAKLFNDWTSVQVTVPKSEAGEEEWVWVTGYKATDKDMKCRDYQYEMNKQHDMPENEVILMCHSGFHFCDKLKDTFRYYEFGNGNRFFEVKALVRRWKKNGYYVTEQRDDKMVAKSIVFNRELTIGEIFDVVNANNYNKFKDWTVEMKEQARQSSITEVENIIKFNKLVELGYSEAFANFAVRKGAYDVAHVMAMTPGVSMDVKVLAVCMDIYE